MENLKKFNKYFEGLGEEAEAWRQSDINELKSIIKELPYMRWNISEDEGYWGDEEDEWQHMEDDERREYFCKIWDTVKKLKDKIESL